MTYRSYISSVRNDHLYVQHLIVFTSMSLYSDIHPFIFFLITRQQDIYQYPAIRRHPLILLTESNRKF